MLKLERPGDSEKTVTFQKHRNRSDRSWAYLIRNTAIYAVKRSDFSATASWRTAISVRTVRKKLSPWFSDRRRSTVEDIKGQLAYREENLEKAAQFRITRSFGEERKVLLDEEHRWFTVTRARDLAEANPDILDFDAITGCRLDIDENRTELTREDADSKDVSCVPPRYEYSYDFFLYHHRPSSLF